MFDIRHRQPSTEWSRSARWVNSGEVPPPDPILVPQRSGRFFEINSVMVSNTSLTAGAQFEAVLSMDGVVVWRAGMKAPDGAQQIIMPVPMRTLLMTDDIIGTINGAETNILYTWCVCGSYVNPNDLSYIPLIPRGQ